jgi:hypothetical protein
MGCERTMASTGKGSEHVSEPQAASAVLMIRPAHFGSNPETAATNAFQRALPEGPAELLRRARVEFDALAGELRAHGVKVHVFDDTPEPVKLDALFPNNWVSFHAGGTAVLYPMQPESRRTEVRPELVERLATSRGGAGRCLDLRAEAGGEFLEGTGSLVLDRLWRVAYACHSPRTSARLVKRFCERLGYEPHLFHARDARGVPAYHTNVVLALGTRFAIVCLEALSDARERAALAAELRASERELVPITLAQMDEFAANALELQGSAGTTLLVLSARARRALDPAQRAVLERHATLVSAELTTIETCGGGSARCMLAEVF